MNWTIYHKRESLAKVIEKHGNQIGRKVKQIKSLRGGNGVHFRCLSCLCSKNVMNWTIYHKRESLVKVIEKHGNWIGRKVKQIKSLRGGDGVHFRCVSLSIEKNVPKKVAQQLFYFKDWFDAVANTFGLKVS
jgi:hypothetical protein